MGHVAHLTADELLNLNQPNKRTELVRGALIVREPAGGEHGVVAGMMFHEISVFVRARSLGIVLAAETGFTLFTDPDTVRAPDVAFIRHDRVPDPLPRGYFTIAPDLAVEVISPGDTSREVSEKVADWLAAGTLDGEDVLPGFTVELGRLFDSTHRP